MALLAATKCCLKIDVCEVLRCRVSRRAILPSATSQMMLNIHPHQCMRWGSGGYESTPTTAGTSKQLSWHGEVPGVEWQLGGAEVPEGGQTQQIVA